ncbi:MAG: M67 family metallopeptidase [Candidatus Thorarchaeota archaeon]|nr:M67 family metallopeptidase [Candidatus Thorarchaeota archaeon]
MQHTLHLSVLDLDILHNHAETNLPLEAAALLFGQVIKSSVIVNRIELVHNEASSSTTSFMVNPEEQYRLLVQAEEQGEELVGIFHSHPAPPFPSSRDQQNMKLNPVVWLIASRESGNWVSKPFLLVDDQVNEVDLNLDR